MCCFGVEAEQQQRIHTALLYCSCLYTAIYRRVTSPVCWKNETVARSCSIPWNPRQPDTSRIPLHIFILFFFRQKIWNISASNQNLICKMCIWVTAKAKAVWSAFKRTHRPFFFFLFLIKRHDLFSVCVCVCVCVCVGHYHLEANKHALPLWWWWGRVIHRCSCKDLWEANYLTRLIAALIPPADNCFGYFWGHCIDYFCSSKACYCCYYFIQ